MTSKKKLVQSFLTSRWFSVLTTAFVLTVAATLPADAQRRWGRRNAWERNGSSTRSAFQDIIKEAGKATVEIEVDGDVVAMGTCIDANGWILTKASTAAAKCTCVLADGRRLVGERRKIIPEHDLALLRVDATDLPIVAWGDGEAPGVGRWIAVPGHEASPIAVGVVSVPPREIESQRAFLGVELEDNPGGGAKILNAIADTPARKAGIRGDDIIVRANDVKVRDRAHLVTLIRRAGAGGLLAIEVRRKGRNVAIDVVLGQRNFDPDDIENSGRVSLRHSGFPVAFQHDAVVTPEQCGGPLVDLDGKVVAINIARANRVASFAIPAGVVREVLDKELPKLKNEASTPKKPTVGNDKKTKKPKFLSE